MTTVRSEESDAWKLARSLRTRVRDAIRNSRGYRDPEFDHQTYRAALSIMSNVAEGWEASGPGEKKQFFSYALRSCGEVRSLLYGGLDDGIFPREEFDILLQDCLRVAQVLAGLLRKTRTRAS